MTTAGPSASQLELEPEAENVIHNGEVIRENPAVQTIVPTEPRKESSQTQSKALSSELDPDWIAAQMAGTVSELLETKPLPSPMDIVNALLRLAPGGKKLVWTRFDVYQAFGLAYSQSRASSTTGARDATK